MSKVRESVSRRGGDSPLLTVGHYLDANTHACTVLAVPKDAAAHSALLAGESFDSLPQVLAVPMVVLAVAVPADLRPLTKAIVASLLHPAAG